MTAENGEPGVPVGAPRARVALAGVKLVSAVFPVWIEIEWSIFPLEYWALAGQLFNVQQGKRIFTVLGIGELVSSSLLGFLLPGIVAAVGAVNVFVLSAAGSGASLLVLRRIVRTKRTPQTCWGAPENRSCENGIRNSAVQPSESIAVATSHTGSHESSAKLPSSPNTSVQGAKNLAPLA